MRVTTRHLTCRPCRRNRALWIAGTALAFYILTLLALALAHPDPEWAPMPHVLVADLAAVVGIFVGRFIHYQFDRHPRHLGARTSR